MAEQKIAETVTKEGTRVEVFEGVKSRENPLVEMVTKGIAGEPIPGEAIERTVDRTKEGLEEAKESGKLGVHGQVLAADVENVMESGERIFKEQNRDKILEELYVESKASAEETVQKGRLEAERLKQTPELQTARTSVHDLYEAIRNLLTTFVKSGEFRVLLSDNIDMLKSLLTQVQENIETAEKPSEITFPEISDALFERFANVLQRVGKNPEYQRAVDNLYTIGDQISSLGWRLKESETATPEQVHSRRALNAASRFIETFTGPHDLDKFKKTWSDLGNGIKEDEELKQSLNEWWEFVQESVRHPDMMQEEANRKKLRGLSDRCRKLIQQDKYRKQFDKLFNKANILIQDIGEEETVKEFRTQTEKFVSHFAYNKEGKPDLWVLDQSFSDLKLLMVPIFRKHLEDIPIDRIEITDPTFDARLSNIVFSATELFPENIRVKTKSISDIGLTTFGEDRTVMKMKMEAHGIKPRFKNLKFNYRRKTFPKMEDYGVADVTFEGNGMYIGITWNMLAREGLNPSVNLAKIKVSIDKLKVNIIEEETKHYFLDKIAFSLMNHRIKRKICKELAMALQSSLQSVDAEVNNWLSSRPLEQLKQTADERLKQYHEESQRKKELEAKKEEPEPKLKEEIPEPQLKEETTATSLKEETTATSLKEETTTTSLKEETTATSLKEEVPVKEEKPELPKEEVPATPPKEEPTTTTAPLKEEPEKKILSPAEIPEPKPDEGVPEPAKVT